jgi:putative transposase
MRKPSPPYLPEYRRKIVALVRAGRNAHELANEFECSAQTIRQKPRPGSPGRPIRRPTRIRVRKGDLVQRRFAALGPDALWVADITYVPTAAGFLYLVVVIDAFSRCVVGWAMQNHLRSELVLQAFEMAYGQRRPRDVVHHSDQARSTPQSPSASAARRWACAHRWARWVTASTTPTPCPRPSSPRSSASCSIVGDSRSRPRPRVPCSTSSKAGTTPQPAHSSRGYPSPVNYEQRQLDAPNRTNPQPSTKRDNSK